MRTMGKLVGVMGMSMLVANLVLAEEGGGEGKHGRGGDGMRKGQSPEAKEFFQKQKEENKAFRETLKGMTNTAERIAAGEKHRTEQHTQNEAFCLKQYEARLAELKERTSKNSKLTPAEQQEVIALCEKLHAERVAFRASNFQASMTFWKELESTEGLTKEQRKEKRQAFHKAQKEAKQKLHEAQKAERKALREKLKDKDAGDADESTDDGDDQDDDER